MNKTEFHIVNGRRFKYQSDAEHYCYLQGFRITGREKVSYGKSPVIIYSVTTADAGLVSAQENAYFDNFCHTNNI